MRSLPYQRSLNQIRSDGLLQDLNDAFNRIFCQAGREFWDAKSAEDYTAIKQKAQQEINLTVDLWRRIRGREEVTRALSILKLSEFDID